MSSQLISIVPNGPLTDEVFPFNRDYFLEIRKNQENDLGFLSSPPVRALVDAGDLVGGTATGITSGVAGIASGAASTVFGGLGQITKGIPGSGLFGLAGQAATGTIGAAEQVAETLIDPSRVVREHIKYSNEVHDHLPAAIAAVDDTIYKISTEIGNVVHELFENIPTKGVQIITALEGRLVKVDEALAGLYDVLTRNHVQENLQVGQEKYKGIRLQNNHLLGEISEQLPKVLKTIQEMKAAFAGIHANLKLAKGKINSGITDPNQIFAEKHEDVEEDWRAFETKRKTMTYLPYKH